MIVGYRYGAAPKEGKSYNYREQEYECGVSMASVGYLGEIYSACYFADRKKYYYVGDFAGFGSDGEVCLSNVKQITYKEYLRLRKESREETNRIAVERYNKSLRVYRKGFGEWSYMVGEQQKRLKDIVKTVVFDGDDVVSY